MSLRRPALPVSILVLATALAAIHCGGDDGTGLVPASGGAAGKGGASGKGGAPGAAGAKPNAGAGGADEGGGAGGEAGQASAGQGGTAAGGKAGSSTSAGQAGTTASAGQAGASGAAGASQGGANAGGEAGVGGSNGTAGAAQGGEAGGPQGGQAGTDPGGDAGAAQGGNAGAAQGGNAGAAQGGNAGAAQGGNAGAAQGGNAGAAQGGNAGAGGLGGQAGAGGVVVGPPRLIIAELRTRGSSGGSDELLEIFNPTDYPVSFDDHWRVWVRPSADECFPAEGRFTGPTTPKIIPARSSVLLGPSVNGNVDGVPTDFKTYYSVGDAASVFLTYNGGVQDALCFAYDSQSFNRFISCSGFVCEGTPIQNGPHDNGGGAVSNVDVSLSRKHGAGPGVLLDTGNNAADFEAVASSPRNLAAGPLPLGAAAKGAAAVTTGAFFSAGSFVASISGGAVLGLRPVGEPSWGRSLTNARGYSAVPCRGPGDPPDESGGTVRRKGGEGPSRASRAKGSLPT